MVWQVPRLFHVTHLQRISCNKDITFIIDEGEIRVENLWPSIYFPGPEIGIAFVTVFPEKSESLL